MVRHLSLVSLLIFLIVGTSEGVTIEWVHVGDSGNAADLTGFGAVDYDYRIGKYEVTKTQYAQFLNAVAIDDPNGLYHDFMETITRGGIIRSGTAGEYSYDVKPGHENQPATFVSFWNTLRFINWLNNGKPTGAQGPTSTEDGAYTLTPEGIEANSISRNPDAKIFLTSEDEWYKAAYYKGGGLEVGYWQYPTQSDIEPLPVPPTSDPNTANFNQAVRNLTDVGAYPGSPGPYGTYDQGGNVWEWNETPIVSKFNEQGRVTRGGSWFLNGPDPLNSSSRGGQVLYVPSSVDGFRVASLVPPLCDLDDNFSCDVADLDLLTQAFGTSNDRYNLDSSNEVIDEGDRDVWLVDAGTPVFGEPFKLGDTNLDGVVNATDLNVLGLNWLAEDVSGWSAADFNGDRQADNQDLNLIGVNWQSDIRPTAATVPEPQLSWLVLATLAFSLRRLESRHS